MILDISVFAILLISALIAFLRGFIREALTIAGVVGGLAAAYYGGPLLAPHMRGWFGITEGEDAPRLLDIIPYSLLADGLSYAGIFIAVVVILSLVSHFLAEAIKSIGLGAVDRSLGVMFGVARGLLVIGLLYLPFYLLMDSEDKREWFQSSHTHIYVEKLAEIMSAALPDGTAEELEKKAGELGDGKGMRQTLEQIDLLKETGINPLQPIAPQAGYNSQTGYDDDFRKDMKGLFEQQGETTTPQ